MPIALKSSNLPFGIIHIAICWHQEYCFKSPVLIWIATPVMLSRVLKFLLLYFLIDLECLVHATPPNWGQMAWKASSTQVGIGVQHLVSCLSPTGHQKKLCI